MIDLDKERLKEVRSLIGNVEFVKRITFELINSPHHNSDKKLLFLL